MEKWLMCKPPPKIFPKLTPVPFPSPPQNHMYRTSLAAFLRLFEENLSDASASGAAASGEKRIQALKHGLQTRVFHYISRQGGGRGDRSTRFF